MPVTLNKNKALYAGSFDPFTNGHYDIVQRATEIFSEVIVLVAMSPNKKPTQDLDERVETIKAVFKNNPKVSVDCWQGLTVDYAQTNQVGIIVRGLRPTGDFDSEFQMASMNKSLASNVETVFLGSHEHNSYISSSLVKEVFSHGGDVSGFVPPEVLTALKKIKGEN